MPTMSPEAAHAIAVLSRALDQAGDALAAVRESDLDQPTPCDGWDVRRLVGHLLAGPHRFVEAVQGGQPDWSVDPDPPAHGWATLFRSAADDLIHAWHQAGSDAEPSSIDWQTAEFAVHTWDLVKATGQNRALNPEVAERGLAFMSAAMTDENRGSAFRPAVDAADDAPVYDRLAAFSGRTI